jgi:hypothetical protein
MSIAKIDVDLAMDRPLWQKFLETRKAIIEELGYILVDVKVAKTSKGFHFWFHLEETLRDKEMCDLQFLLGDDQPRCRFNYLRNDAQVFPHFNALFSKKLKRYRHKKEEV